MRLWFCLIFLVLAQAVQARDASQIGVFGTVERVAPLVVAGQQIEMPADLPVISPLGTGQSILVGDVLAVRGVLVGGRLHAERVLAIHLIVGPVSGLAERTATVMGTDVHIPPEVTVNIGGWYAVSGLWRGDTVITSRMRGVEPGSFGQIIGVLDEDGPKIGSSIISGGQIPKDGYGDDIWILNGTPQEKGLSVRLNSKGVFGGPVDLALWQGYATPPVASQTYMIHGTSIAGTASDAQIPGAGALITRCVGQSSVLKAAPEGLSTAFLALGCAKHILAD